MNITDSTEKQRTILDFKRAAQTHDVCSKYNEQWDRAQSPRELMGIALCIQGIEFIAKSIAEGWGMTPGYIYIAFGDYINGRLIHREQAGYTSEMYCCHEGEFTVRTTNIILIDCQCVVNVPEGYLCNIYVTGGKSSVAVFNEGAYAHVIRYGDAQVSIQGDGNTHFTEG